MPYLFSLYDSFLVFNAAIVKCIGLLGIIDDDNNNNNNKIIDNDDNNNNNKNKLRRNNSNCNI